MSQYPYQPPSNTPYGYGYYPQDPLAALLAPAKRASIIMFIIGGLMLPCGLLVPVAMQKADRSQMLPQQAAKVQQMEQQLTAVGWSLAQFYRVMGACVCVPGVILVVLGAVVRRGGMGSVVASIIFCGLMGLGMGLMMLAMLAEGGLIEAGLMFLAVAGLIAAEVFLFQAAGRAAQVSAYRSGMAAGAYPGYPGGYPQQPQYPSQQPQSWQQPGVGPWGSPQQQAGWGQNPPMAPPPPPPPPSDREG